MAQKAMTLRLQAEMAEALERIAEVDRMSVADEVREAIARHIEERRADTAFQERLSRFMDRDRAILDRLAQ